MAKESLYGIERRLVFRETFESEESVRRNGGVPSVGYFENGMWNNFGESTNIYYKRFIPKGRYTFRFKVVNNIQAGYRYIFSYNPATWGSIRLAAATHAITGISNISLVASYVDGASASVLPAGTHELVCVVDLLIDIDDFYMGNYGTGAVNYTAAKFELFEIYSGTLTPQEVKNLYENKRHRELNVNTLGRKEILNVSADSGVVRNKYSGERYVNLLANGDFETGVNTDAWQLDGGVIAQFNSTEPGCSGNYCLKLIVANTYYGISRNGTLKINSTYIVNIRYKSPNSIIRLRDSGLFQYDLAASADWVEASWRFTATQTYFRIWIASINENVFIDFLSIKEVIPSVIPTAISLVKQGEVNAMLFNSTTSKILNGSYDSLIGDKTIIAWINPYSAGSGDGRIIDNGRLLFYVNIQRIRFTNTGSDVVSGVMGTIHYDRKFKQVVLVRRSTGSADLYINGAYNQTLSGGGTPVAGGDIYIGNNSLNTRWFDGLMDGVRIIDGILTLEEISQLYTNEKDKYGL